MVTKEQLDKVAAKGDLRRVGEAIDHFLALVLNDAVFTEFGPSESDISDALRELDKAVAFARSHWR